MPRLPFAKSFSGFCIFSLIFVQGCASTPDLPPPSPPPDAGLRASLGTVGVISAGAPLGAEVSGPIGFGGEAREGAMEGAIAVGGLGAVGGALYGLACGPAFWLCSPILAAGFGLAGGATGAAAGGLIKGANAIPTDTATELQAVLFQEISDSDLRADLREHILTQAVGTSGRNVVNLGTGYAMFGASVSDDAIGSSAAPDTVLEIAITEIALTGEGGSDPSFSLSISAGARLIRVSDNQLLWSDARIPYVSAPADVPVWTATDSDHLESEINSGLAALAQQIYGLVFGEVHRNSEPELISASLTGSGVTIHRRQQALH